LHETLHLDARNPADIDRAADLLRSGKLVAFATETVYGLGANALSAEAVAQIFAAKQRPSWDPLIVHLDSAAQLSTITNIPAALAPRIQQLAEAFWPGPLTLLLPRKPNIPDAVTAGRDLVGVRVPAHPAAQALLAAANLPIAAPSANTFGHTSPTTAQHVLNDLAGRIDAVLDAGPTAIGLESTVLDPTQTPMVIYRPGAVTAEQLLQTTGVAITAYRHSAHHVLPASLPSPGVGIRHYAPRATLVLTDPTPESLWDRAADQLIVHSGILSRSPKLGVLLPAGWPAPPVATLFDWGPFDAPETLAARLFAGLRSLDDAGVDLILAPLPPRFGLNDAIRDRLQKAAKPK
jgi:L-threonylcarbamoyladenylate synthase